MKLHKVLIFIIFSGLCFNLQSQDDKEKKGDTSWTKGYELGANFNLSGSSPNWSAGAANNLAANVFFNHFRNWKKKNKTWDNSLKTNLGYISFFKTDLKNNSYRVTRKNLDQLFFDSKYGVGFKKPKWLAGYIGLNIQSQMLPGYNYLPDSIGRDSQVLASSFMSTGFLTEAIGLEAKPRDWFFIRLGGAAFKQTIVLNQKIYNSLNTNEIGGVPKDKVLKNEIGFQLQAGLNKDFGKDKMFNVKCNYLGFISPRYFKTSPLDSRIDLGLVANLGKYVKFNYTLISIFDKDLRAPGINAWQNSWIVGLGFLTKW